MLMGKGFLRKFNGVFRTAAAAAVCAMGVAGELAWARMSPQDGNATYRDRIIDAVCRMDGAALEKGANYEMR